MRITPDDTAMLDAIAAEGANLIGRAEDWCAINSGSFNATGLALQREALEQCARSIACTIEQIALAPTEIVRDDGLVEMRPNEPALQLSVRPEAPVQVVLTGHYDTVYPPSSPFQSVIVREDGTLNGPGIADMKGGLSVMLGALEAFEHHPFAHRIGWTALISPDEEVGSHGSAPVLARLGARGHVGLTYEPALADGSLAGARKGSGNFHIVVKGRSAHAGRAFFEGRNAVAGAALIASQLHAINGTLPDVSVNVARIDGGAALNVVADVAIVRFNVRVPDEDAAAAILEAIARIMREAPFEGLSCHLHGGFTRPPKPMDAAQSALFEHVRRAGDLLGQPIAWKASGGVCEGNNLYAAGLANIDTLGVRGGDIHSEGEYAIPESFAERAQLSALLLAKIAEGTIDALALKRLRHEAVAQGAP